jgi:signal transduction histidine kinase
MWQPRALADGLRIRLARASAPLNLAAYVTWIAVFIATVDWPAAGAGNPRELVGALALLLMLALFISFTTGNHHHRSLDVWSVVAQGALILLANFLLAGGPVGVLLIVVAAQLVWICSVRVTVALLATFNLVMLATWWHLAGNLPQRLLDLIPLLGFQGFAALTAHYASSSSRQTERLSQLNAELLATRCLLEESARSGERLKLSRELHDVTGHKLTALKLTLASLKRDTALADNAELALSTQLADELLSDIRGVTHALRQHEGLELGEALRALARPLPHTDIEMDIEPDLRADSVAQGEALVRCTQEAITNALRHGQARHVRVHCRREGTDLALSVFNDGAVPERIDDGNGIRGMRERLQELGGSLQIALHPPSGMQLSIRVPSPATS